LHVGIDSTKLERRLISLTGEPEKFFKALLGVSVTTNDEDTFRRRYEESLDKAFSTVRVERKKRVYKGAHLLMQTVERTPDIIRIILEELEDCIEHIDVYCAFYSRPYISMFGKTRFQRLEPLTFIENVMNAFPHVCAWFYLQNYSEYEDPLSFDIDHFSGNITPAWRELTGSNIEVYFSGDECNAIISTADLTLRLIDMLQRGDVNGMSLFAPIKELCPSYRTSGKLRFNNLGDRGWKIKASVPDTHLSMDLTPYLKHPIFFHVWDPGRPRERVKKSFEWSPIYNAVAGKAFENKGAMKSLDFDRDIILWNADIDRLVIWSETDEQYINMLKGMGHTVPKVLHPNDLQVP